MTLLRHRKTCGDRQAMAEPAGVHRDPGGQLLPHGMAREARNVLQIGEQLLVVEPAELGEAGIEAADAVPLAENEFVVSAHAAVRLDLIAQHMKIERREDVGLRHIAAGMAALGRGVHDANLLANFLRPAMKRVAA